MTEFVTINAGATTHRVSLKDSVSLTVGVNTVALNWAGGSHSYASDDPQAAAKHAVALQEAFFVNPGTVAQVNVP